ncbi:MAG: FAD-dependent oxidoreductase [Gammaproteobacteria bacterium]|nr:FAD-dependent oxidoreductase [Gammaproteobacteria bacterium]
MSASGTQDVLVIGAGIIGISAALALQAQGRNVLVLDRKGAGAEASKANAGAFAFSDIVPLATPGIMRTAPKWLLDPLGPLSIPPTYLPRVASWLWRFWRASRPARYRAALDAQAALMRLSQAALDRQAAAVAGAHLLRPEGQLQLFDSAQSFRASLPVWEERARHGIRFRLLESAAAIAEIQPGLAARFTHAGYTPDWVNAGDPAQWLAHLAEVFRARGGQTERADVAALAGDDGAVRVMLNGGDTRRADLVVLAAGAWSRHLACGLGDAIPLETERGYNTTLPAGAFDLRTHLTFADHGFVVSRVGDGVRVGGAVELGGLTRPPDYRRAEVLLQKAERFMPGLRREGGTQWMGFRPSLPDSLPVIGRAPGCPRVIHAFGHGHLGLTQAAGTAEIVAALAAGAPPPIDPTPFSPSRF